MKSKVAPEVALHYAKYKNKKSKLKTTQVLSTKFDVDEHYEIIDLSIYFFIKLAKGLMEL